MAPKWLKRASTMRRPGAAPPEAVGPLPEGAVDAFVAFVEADSFPDVLENFAKLVRV